MSFEYTKSRGSPRTSQMPWSVFVPAPRGGVGQARRGTSCVARARGRSNWSESRCTRVEQLAVDVELALAPRAVADPHRRAVAPARQVGQLPLGEVVLAADAEHDLQVVAPSDATPAADVVM